MLYTLEAGDCLFCIQFIEVPEIYGNVCGDKNCFSLKVTKIPRKAEKARKFLKDRAFYQSKCDKNSEKGRENMRILEKTVLFLSLKVTKILGKAEKAWNFLKDKAFSQSKCDQNSEKGRENMKEGKEHGIDIYS